MLLKLGMVLCFNQSVEEWGFILLLLQFILYFVRFDN